MHIEDRNNQWYLYPGFVAGRASDVLIATGTQPAAWAIDGWISAPFHRFPLLNPNLQRVGYGSFCEDGTCAAAINIASDALSGNLQFRRRIMSGEPITGDSEALGGGWGTHYPSPIIFPPDGSDQVTQKIGRAGLKNSGAIIILPREPLRSATRYAVTAVVDDKTYRWSFSTSGAGVSMR
jgi:hypothetical protein